MFDETINLKCLMMMIHHRVCVIERDSERVCVCVCVCVDVMANKRFICREKFRDGMRTESVLEAISWMRMQRLSTLSLSLHHK